MLHDIQGMNIGKAENGEMLPLSLNQFFNSERIKINDRVRVHFNTSTRQGWEKGGLSGADYGETSLEGKLGKSFALKEWKNLFLSVLPLLIFYLILQKQFVESIEKSGITGE